MCKSLLRPRVRAAVLVFHVLSLQFAFASGEDSGSQQPAADAVSRSLLTRAESDVSKIKVLVEQGTLPRSRLAEAEEHLADVRDEVTLSRTLYGQSRLQDITPQQANDMSEAAQRRVQRQEKIVEDHRPQVAAGILAKADFETLEQELIGRERVLRLVENRVKLLDELKEMAEAEKRLEAAQNAAALSSVMVRYNGNGVFKLSDIQRISHLFEQKFHRPLPISAFGQTSLHQSMGLDHRNRVDVPLNPFQPEGLWLRALLEQLHIPYLAFRSAFAGAATAPHIHIGLGSSRISGTSH